MGISTLSLMAFVYNESLHFMQERSIENRQYNPLIVRSINDIFMGTSESLGNRQISYFVASLSLGAGAYFSRPKKNKFETNSRDYRDSIEIPLEKIPIRR